MKNPVAKHARKYNRAVVMRDRKKDLKRGRQPKHRDRGINAYRRLDD